ncbi:hypothetical protein Y1Q_0008478 [Alligator mississippiensis]|uniref:Secreted protein n=1 Tax=Alligator mississippiensis TaxID=8496 RepID=A0A151M1F2_ALLMI|nr:hypothetical protein Y1Q_0008478 [Alligator mississippiensis]
MHIISILGGVWAVAGCLRHCADPGHAATQHAHQVQGCTALRSAPEPCALLRTHRTNISLPAIALSFSTRLTGITPCQHGSRSEINVSQGIFLLAAPDTGTGGPGAVPAFDDRSQSLRCPG